MSDAERQRTNASSTIPLATLSDLERVPAIPDDGCPRRYCFWWGLSGFAWELPASFGCTFLRRAKPPGWLRPDAACCRADPASPIDHFETSDPQVEADGVDTTRWVEACKRSRTMFGSSTSAEGQPKSADSEQQ
jgi:hypothetical protein